MSTKNDGVTREYPSNIIKPVLDEAEKFFSDKENAGMCFGNANNYGGDLVTVKLRTTKDPHTGFIITFSTLFHELIHSVGNQLVKFETDMKTINLNVILRQLMLGYVYWILKESLTIWKPEPIAETVEVPATETPA